MKKILLNFSLLLFALTINACITKGVSTNTNQQIIPIGTTQAPSSSITTPPRAIVIAPSSAGEYHQLQTVQGPILTVQERSNGFIFPQYSNKVVLLQIFGQDCPYCFKEIPIINNINKKYIRNLQVVGVQAQNPMTKQTATNLIQRFQMNYPIIDKNEAQRLLYFIQNTYGWTGILPYILIIKNGVTEYSFAGEVSYQELDEAVQSLI